VAAPRDIAGRRYATAILEIARADGDLDGWLGAVEALEGLTGPSGYVEALQGDGMTDANFQEIVRRVYPEVTAKQLNLFRLLRRKSRMSLGPSIAAFFREMVDQERGVVRASVTSAVELDEGRRASLLQRLREETGHDVVLEERIDPEVLGGLVVRIGDRMLDGSARSRLRALRSRLEQVSIA
jgi:F-type H+-transporting ATPase subunit delta